MSVRTIVFALCMMIPAVAHAQEKAACLQAHEHGQELRLAGKWRAARAEFATCSSASCPSALSKDCVGWNAELADKQPTLVVVARTPTGEDTLDASLDIDGEHRSDALSGSAIDLDPGEHVLVLRHRGWVDATKKVVVHEGDHERVALAFTELPPVVVVVTQPLGGPDLAIPRKKKGTPAASIVLAVIGGLAVGAGAALDASGGVDYNLGCYNHCTSAQADSINTRFIAGDVALGAGIVVLGISLIVALVRH
jgi:hypothetical protein